MAKKFLSRLTDAMRLSGCSRARPRLWVRGAGCVFVMAGLLVGFVYPSDARAQTEPFGSCQEMSDTRGTHHNVTWGTATQTEQDWWMANACNTSPGALAGLRGDVNCDSQLNILDSLFISQYLADDREPVSGCPLQSPTTQINLDAADFNRDGVVDGVDLALISECETTPNAFCDNQPPSEPVWTVGTVTSTSMELTWESSVDNAEVAAYRIMFGDTQAGTALGSENHHVVQNIFRGGDHPDSFNVHVLAFDYAGNKSSYTSMVVQLPSALECQGLAVTVDLARGQTPTSGDDVIVGTDGADTILALAGNDVICAGAGDDVVEGGAGNDVILGGPGDDWLRGGQGDDDLAGEDGDDELIANDGSDLLSGGDGADELFGRAGPDVLDGGPGDDTLFGEGGDDLLSGGDGNDDLDGGAGDDDLDGEAGHDVANGKAGNDACSAETLTNCEAQVSGVVRDAGGLTVAGASVCATSAANITTCATTSSDGAFELRSQPGTNEIVVSNSGFLTEELTVTISGSQHSFDVLLSRPAPTTGTLHGVVTRTLTTPSSGKVNVCATPMLGGAETCVIAEGVGEMEYELVLPVGDYEVEFSDRFRSHRIHTASLHVQPLRQALDVDLTAAAPVWTDSTLRFTHSRSAAEPLVAFLDICCVSVEDGYPSHLRLELSDGQVAEAQLHGTGAPLGSALDSLEDLSLRFSLAYDTEYTLAITAYNSSLPSDVLTTTFTTVAEVDSVFLPSQQIPHPQAPPPTPGGPQTNDPVGTPALVAVDAPGLDGESLTLVDAHELVATIAEIEAFNEMPLPALPPSSPGPTLDCDNLRMRYTITRTYVALRWNAQELPAGTTFQVFAVGGVDRPIRRHVETSVAEAKIYVPANGSDYFARISATTASGNHAGSCPVRFPTLSVSQPPTSIVTAEPPSIPSLQIPAGHPGRTEKLHFDCNTYYEAPEPGPNTFTLTLTVRSFYARATAWSPPGSFCKQFHVLLFDDVKPGDTLGGPAGSSGHMITPCRHPTNYQGALDVVRDEEDLISSLTSTVNSSTMNLQPTYSEISCAVVMVRNYDLHTEYRVVSF